MVKNLVVIADCGVITAKRQLEIIIQVVFQQQALYIDFKPLLGGFAESNFAQHRGLGSQMGGYEETGIAHREATVAMVAKSQQRGLRRTRIGGPETQRSKASEFNPTEDPELSIGLARPNLGLRGTLNRWST